MKLTVHGSRGSIPTPSKHTVKYGGNTSCFELEFGKYQIFFDTGSGFKNISLADKQIDKLIFYSHWHHDHIQGLPFNSHIFNQENKITVTSALASRNVLRHTLQTYFSGGYFPVDIVRVLSNLVFKNISTVKKTTEKDFHLDWLELQHPGGCYGYSIIYDGKKICYLCDNEYDEAQLPLLEKFTDHSDLVIWDGMFTEDELTEKVGWGHSSIEQGVKFFDQTNIKSMMITHHAPYRTDNMLDEIASSLPDGVYFAKDEMSITI
jgi:phosphoribosyl 1,2-cyclic phosphodiesterase